jgi:hypothetical protein
MALKFLGLMRKPFLLIKGTGIPNGQPLTLEFTQIDDYHTFIDKGHHTKVKIRVHLIFDAKHHGRHKARLVADGHCTDILLE